jgi:hypothetical protein
VAALKSQIVLALLCLPALARAQESIRTIDAESSDPGWSCNSSGIVDVRPAILELGPWWSIGGGVRWEPERPVFSLGGGLDATFGTALGPAIQGGRFELRAGPWIGFETPLDRFRVEGGLSVGLGQVEHARFGTLGLRVGAGYGAGYQTGGATHLVAALTYGIRYVQYRARPPRGPCDPPSPPAVVALASGARLFAAVRRGLDESAATEIVFGLELEPSWLFPPYSRAKLIGASR